MTYQRKPSFKTLDPAERARVIALATAALASAGPTATGATLMLNTGETIYIPRSACEPGSRQ